MSKILVTARLLNGLALLPLVVGSTIFVVWYLTRIDSLMLAGVYTIIGGGIVVFITFVLLVIFIVHRSKEQPPQGKWKLQAAIAGVLCFLNIPAAALFSYLGLVIATRIEVDVINASNLTIEEPRLKGPTQEINLSPIKPGDTSSVHLYPQGEGRITLNFKVRDRERSIIIVGYVPSPSGHQSRVTIEQDLSVHATDIRSGRTVTD